MAEEGRCKLCGRELAAAGEEYGPGDPRIDCGGDCLACMWSVESEAGKERAQRPDEFQLGMDDDRVWVGLDGEGGDPLPVFALSTREVQLLTGQGIEDSRVAMGEVLVLDERMRKWLRAAEEGKIG